MGEFISISQFWNKKEIIKIGPKKHTNYQPENWRKVLLWHFWKILLQISKKIFPQRFPVLNGSWEDISAKISCPQRKFISMIPVKYNWWWIKIILDYFPISKCLLGYMEYFKIVDKNLCVERGRRRKYVEWKKVSLYQQLFVI